MNPSMTDYTLTGRSKTVKTNKGKVRVFEYQHNNNNILCWVCDKSVIVDSKLYYNSIVANSSLIESKAYTNSIIIDSKVTESSISNNSKVLCSNVNNSEIHKSTVLDSYVWESSRIEFSHINNSHITRSRLHYCFGVFSLLQSKAYHVTSKVEAILNYCNVSYLRFMKRVGTSYLTFYDSSNLKLKVYNVPKAIYGFEYPIILFDNYIQIGCKRYTIEQWEQFDDNEIKRMDDYTALDFWGANKDMVISMAKHNQERIKCQK